MIKIGKFGDRLRRGEGKYSTVAKIGLVTVFVLWVLTATIYEGDFFFESHGGNEWILLIAAIFLYSLTYFTARRLKGQSDFFIHLPNRPKGILDGDAVTLGFWVVTIAWFVLQIALYGTGAF